MPNYFRNPDALVDAVRAVLSGQPVEEKMDPVDPKALKGKHKDRKDKDIDNDGDVDSSDEYLHNRRKAISKAMKEGVVLGEAKTDAYHKEMLKALGKSKLPKGHQYTSAVASNGDFVVYDGGKRIVGRLKKGEHSIKEEVELEEDIIQKYRDEVSKLEAKKNKTSYEIGRLKMMKQRLRKIDEETDDNPANTQHLCAKNVVHENWGEGVCIPTMHADPDAEGNVAWYDIMFEHGIESRVSIDELKVTKAESHMHASKKKKMVENDDMDGEDDTDSEDDDDKKGKKKVGKKDEIDTEPNMDDRKMTAEMSDKQMKKREEIVKSMKKKSGDFKKRYGDRAKDVMYATATKMAMKEGFELGIEKSEFIEEVELDEAKNYEIKNGKIHISKANFRKVHKDYKNSTKGKERMMALDPKSGATTSYEVVFEEVELDEVGGAAFGGTIDKIQKVVDDKTAMKIDGVMVDTFTASLIMNIFKKVNKQNQDKMRKMKVTQLANAAYKLSGMKEEVELEEKFDYWQSPDSLAKLAGVKKVK